MENLNSYLRKLNALNITPKGDKRVCITKAQGRILSENIVCKIAIPRFDNSAMDGYAIRLNKNKPYESYVIKGEIFAGDSKDYALKDNDAFYIATGARVPKNCDCVIQKELVEIKDNALFLKAIPLKNQCIKLRGEDFKEGEILLKKGEILDSNNIGILAMQGISKVMVKKKVKIIIFGSGDEVARLNNPLKNNQIYDINSHFIRANFCHLNCKITYGDIIKDNAKSLESTLKNALKKYDIIITSGGVSVGERDYIHRTLQTLRAEILADSINIKPGRPVVLSTLQNKFILNLPGNPIGAFLQSYFCLPILVAKFSDLRYKRAELPLKSFEIPNGADFKISKNTTHIFLGNIKNNAFFAFNNAKYQGAQIAPLLKSSVFAVIENFSDKSCVKKGEIIRIFTIKPKFYKN